MSRLVYGIGALLAAAATVWAGESWSIEFPRLNATFRDLSPEILPVSSGGLTIILSSPANSLTIRRHELLLEPTGDGGHRFRGLVDFMGKADLVAELGSGLPAKVEDQVLLPIQQVEVEGEVEIARRPEGYEVTTRTLPSQVEIAMQSRLGNRMVSLCETLSILTGGDCAGLAAAFGRARVPLPGPGETYLLEAGMLTPSERAILDDYLDSALTGSPH